MGFRSGSRTLAPFQSLIINLWHGYTYNLDHLAAARHVHLLRGPAVQVIHHLLQELHIARQRLLECDFGQGTTYLLVYIGLLELAVRFLLEQLPHGLIEECRPLGNDRAALRTAGAGRVAFLVGLEIRPPLVSHLVFRWVHMSMHQV